MGSGKKILTGGQTLTRDHVTLKGGGGGVKILSQGVFPKKNLKVFLTT